MLSVIPPARLDLYYSTFCTEINHRTFHYTNTLYHIPYTIYHTPLHHIPYTIHHTPYTIYHYTTYD